jgi:hypothetical protein
MICTCRDPMELGVVHRADAPCYYPNPPKEWQGLTDDEIKEIVGPWGGEPIKGYTRELINKIEAKLKEKNT